MLDALINQVLENTDARVFRSKRKSLDYVVFTTPDTKTAVIVDTSGPIGILRYTLPIKPSRKHGSAVLLDPLETPLETVIYGLEQAVVQVRFFPGDNTTYANEGLRNAESLTEISAP